MLIAEEAMSKGLYRGGNPTETNQNAQLADQKNWNVIFEFVSKMTEFQLCHEKEP